MIPQADRGPTRLPNRIAVVGGGRMGSGIAHAFLLGGAEVTVIEQTTAASDSVVARISELLAESDRRTPGFHFESRVQRLSSVTEFANVHGAGLVIEAIYEDVKQKKLVLAACEAIISPDCVLATNTSSISISDLASALQRPDRFLGLHFFNPVPASHLVEIVRGERTSQRVVEAARSWASAINKESVVVRDSPGFASSRLGVILGLEAIRMLEEGVASAEDIDRTMVLAYKHPLGPLYLTDLVGLDVRLDIAHYLADKLGSRFTAPKLLEEKVAAGELGRKTGRGFFAHDK